MADGEVGREGCDGEGAGEEYFVGAGVGVYGGLGADVGLSFGCCVHV